MKKLAESYYIEGHEYLLVEGSKTLCNWIACPSDLSDGCCSCPFQTLGQNGETFTRVQTQAILRAKEIESNGKSRKDRLDESTKGEV